MKMVDRMLLLLVAGVPALVVLHLAHQQILCRFGLEEVRFKGSGQAIIETSGGRRWRVDGSSLTLIVNAPIHDKGKGPSGSQDNVNIPQVIHQLYRTPWIPPEYVTWMRSWTSKHPHWTYWFWSDTDIKQFIQKHYPRYLFTRGYYRDKTALHQSMMARYLILYHYGGFVVDLDMECLQPIDAWTQGHHCLLTQEIRLYTSMLNNQQEVILSSSFMGCVPGHPFIRALLGDDSQILPDIIGPHLNTQKLNINTSHPVFLAENYITHVTKSKSDNFPERTSKEYPIVTSQNVTIVSPKYFMPVHNPQEYPNLNRVCNGDSRVPHINYICTLIQDNGNFTAETYAYRHWNQLNNATTKGPDRTLVDDFVPQQQLKRFSSLK